MKKYLLILLSILLISLVACGNGDLEETIKDQENEIKELEKELESTKRHNIALENRIEEEKEDSEDDGEEQEESSEDDVEETSEEDSNSTYSIEDDVKDVVDEDLKDTTITDLKVNEDASVDEEQYIVLVDLEWDVKNGASTTKDMLDMYSDHLASKLADDELIHELVLFWTVPYHNEDESILKRTYENKDDGMFLGDEAKDVNIFD